MLKLFGLYTSKEFSMMVEYYEKVTGDLLETLRKQDQTIDGLTKQLAKASKNDHRDAKGRFTKAPK